MISEQLVSKIKNVLLNIETHKAFVMLDSIEDVERAVKMEKINNTKVKIYRSSKQSMDKMVEHFAKKAWGKHRSRSFNSI